MKKLILSLTLLIAIVSCSKKEDVESPIFSYITEPDDIISESVVSLRSKNVKLIEENASSFKLSGKVSDNTELKKLKIKIYSNNSGETLKSNSLYKFLEVEKTTELSGVSNYEFDYSIDLPTDELFISGIYDVDFFATDAKGNETTFKNLGAEKRQIYLQRPYQPGILHEYDNDFNNNGYVYNKVGDFLDFKGEIEQFRGGKELSVTFIRIEILSQNISVFDQYWGNSVYFNNSSGQALSGLTLPIFTNNKADISDMLNNLGNNNFKPTNTHLNNSNRLRITVEDEAKNLSIKEYILLITSDL